MRTHTSSCIFHMECFDMFATIIHVCLFDGYLCMWIRSTAAVEVILCGVMVAANNGEAVRLGADTIRQNAKWVLGWMSESVQIAEMRCDNSEWPGHIYAHVRVRIRLASIHRCPPQCRMHNSIARTHVLARIVSNYIDCFQIPEKLCLCVESGYISHILDPVHLHYTPIGAYYYLHVGPFGSMFLGYGGMTCVHTHAYRSCVCTPPIHECTRIAHALQAWKVHSL